MKPIIITGALCLGLLVLGIWAFLAAQRSATQQPITTLTTPVDPLAPDQHMKTLSIPSFSLTDQHGDTITDSVFDGHITIVAFMFTNCPFICPPMGANLHYALQQLEGTSVRVVTFSVDPAHDTPQTLALYLDALGADQSRWTFLTGDIAIINTILTQGLSLSEATPDESNPITLDAGVQMPNVTHPGFFILLDPDANILALYDGTNGEQVTQLIIRARSAEFALSK